MGRPPEDQGVAVYFTYNGSEQCIPCDKWRTIRENMRAIELTIAALHGLDRWEAKEVVNAAFFGSKALAPGDDAAFVSGQLHLARQRGLVGGARCQRERADGSRPRRLPSRDLATVVSRRSLSGSSRRMTPGWLRDEAQL
jgi:hypothetical protein